jgi:hypothetical protein
MPPQPLFMEITEAESRRPMIIGLAHVRTITVDAESQVAIELDGGQIIEPAELWDQVRAALGVIARYPS